MSSVNLSKGDLTLQEAAEYGDVSEVRRFLDNGQDINKTDYAGRTALHEAVMNNNTEVVRVLLENRKIDVNLTTGGSLLGFFDPNDRLKDIRLINRTALQLAAEYGYEETVRGLLGNERINLMIEDELGETAFEMAVRNGHEGVVRILLKDKRIDLNTVGKSGDTALHLAVKLGLKEIVKILIEDGRIDVNAVNNENLTALQIANIKESTEIVEIIDRGDWVIVDNPEHNL